MIQITRAGLRVPCDSELNALASAFQRCHCVRLTGFLERPLLEKFTSSVESAAFRETVHVQLDEGTVDLRLVDQAIVGGLVFLMQDPRLLRLIERVTGAAGLCSFL